MKTLFIIAFSALMLSASAQQQFVTKGRIEYERKMNQHKPMEDQADNVWYQQMLKVYPKFVNDNYELRFDTRRSVYKLVKENTENKYLQGIKPSIEEGVVQDLDAKTTSTKREVFENTYLIQDSLRNLEWRITDETREIAGFECRKAVTKICDSVYVVAFYTDQIPVSSGPETFGGLPGMILGLAVPRLYTTWFATKVELTEPTTAQLSPVQKGKKVTWSQLQAELQKGFKDWGKEAEKRIWVSSL
ncbi:GLPGLI family protein [Sediminibacterium roseum]|uniref:GLPGLI family protein n=1 Tax=Sediminibacterium roseum TaxID=1978412 RepID=A0ABW9ZVK3_9BACT|nr:GLPGLI family protein [Sediminibacterium roseum]NCI51181.1 GLPGLI family protein [Sediminibacterium roseum]